MKRKKVHQATVEQIRALGSEMRLRMFHRLTEGERSEAELAAALGVPARSLYYHLRILLDVGLVEQTGVRHTAKKPQALYQSIADSIEVKSRDNDRKKREAIVENVQTLLRIAAREFETGMLGEGDSNKLCLMTRQRLCLTRTSRKRFQQELDALTDKYSVKESGGRIVCFTAVAAPRK